MRNSRLIPTLVILLLAASIPVLAQQPDKSPIYRASLPQKDWAVDILASAFSSPIGQSDLSDPKALLRSFPFWLPGSAERLSDDGREYLLWVFRRSEEKHHPSYARLSILLEPAAVAGGPLQLRDFALKALAKQSNVKPSGIKTWDYNQIPVVRFSGMWRRDGDNGYVGSTPITEFGPRSQAGLFVKDDVWITVTLTASPFDAEQESLFNSILDSVRFVDTSASQNSFDYYHKGRVLFLAKNYGKASEFLGAAFSLEQSKRQLDLASWRDLIAKLADSYGATVNRDQAKNILQYGIIHDSTNHSFYMGLARLYASLGDADNTLANLEKAYFYMKKENPKVWLPDPRNDPAFARYMKIESFRKAVNAMRK